jgi:cold shock CspA family protein
MRTALIFFAWYCFVDRVLREGSGKGIKAIVVYPMNALANSQFGELEKFQLEVRGTPAASNKPIALPIYESKLFHAFDSRFATYHNGDEVVLLTSEQKTDPLQGVRTKFLFPSNEIYFHRNSVLNSAFEHLAIGDEVIYSEEAGYKGPRATTIRLAGKHHPMGVPEE